MIIPIDLAVAINNMRKELIYETCQHGDSEGHQIANYLLERLLMNFCGYSTGDLDELEEPILYKVQYEKYGEGIGTKTFHAIDETHLEIQIRKRLGNTTPIVSIERVR